MKKIISANIQLLSSNKDIVKFIEDNEVGVPCIYMSESLINKFKNDKMTLLATIDCKKRI